MTRDNIPVDLKRAVLVEAGHRCAIPTCRATTTEIAHIIPWSETKEHVFENLVALCPNCHTRFDQKKEIDRKSMLIYKGNLGILNNRYGEFERRMFEILARSGDRLFVLGAGGDILLNNAVQDGLFIDKKVEGMGFDVTSSEGWTKNFPMTFTYWVTDAGVEFIERFAAGGDIG
jgi:hypothetical protein